MNKRKISLIAMSLLYIVAGLNHFIHPGFYEKIMPWYLPYPARLVAISGVAEIILGMLVLLQPTRRAACWLIVAMLAVFLMVHVQMIIDYWKTPGFTLVIALLRLPLQFVLMRWAYKLRDTDFKKYSRKIPAN